MQAFSRRTPFLAGRSACQRIHSPQTPFALRRIQTARVKLPESEVQARQRKDGGDEPEHRQIEHFDRRHETGEPPGYGIESRTTG